MEYQPHHLLNHLGKKSSYQVFVSVDHDRGGPRAAGVDLNSVSDGGGFTDAELLSFVSHGDLA